MAAEIELATDMYNGSLISLGSSKGLTCCAVIGKIVLSNPTLRLPFASFNIPCFLSLSVTDERIMPTVGFAAYGYKQFILLGLNISQL
jgi:hypothetical protein